MTDPIGSNVAVVKAALLARLAERPALAEVPVGEHPPVKAIDLRDADGNLDAIWLSDATAEGDDGVIILKAAPLEIDETFSFTVAIQSIRPLSSATQAECDARAVELLGEVFYVLAQNPVLGIDPDAYLWLEVLPAGWRQITGRLQSGFGTRFELRLACSSRLGFDA